MRRNPAGTGPAGALTVTQPRQSEHLSEQAAAQRGDSLLTIDPFQPGLLGRIPPPRKVALLRASRIGDFLCAIPAIRSLRRALPAAEITMVTLPILRDLVERSPHIDRYADFPGYPGLAQQLFEPRRAACFFQQMQAERFDLAIQMQGSGANSNPFMLMLGARATAGWVRPGDSADMLDAALPFPDHGHEIHRVLGLTEFLGAPPHGDGLEYPLWPEDRAGAASLLSSLEEPLIGVHPVARDITRRWMPERFVESATQLLDRHGGTAVVVGDAWEQEIGDRVACGIGDRCVNLTGCTSLPVLGAVIDRLDVLLTNDTGPAHIAYALGVPTVTIVGGADPAQYGALGNGPHELLLHDVPCRPCDVVACPVGYTCLQNVAVDAVVAAAERVMTRGRDLP